jgi:hypothetical protein
MKWFVDCFLLNRPYGGSFNGRKIIQSRYLILSGNISFQDMQNYLAEFFNPTHCEGSILHLHLFEKIY